MAKFIKQLPDGHVACLIDQEGIKDMPYIVELYTPRQPSTGAIFPMPVWLDQALRGNSDLFRVMAQQVTELEDWGLS